MTLIVLICDPARFRLDAEEEVWIGSGFDDGAAERFRGQPSAEHAARLCREAGDCSVIHVRIANGLAINVECWRGATSAYEIFYTRRPNGAVFISDHFRNILAELPVSDRGPSDRTILQHFLFRTVPARNTYSRAVSRLGHGERLSMDLATGAMEVSLFDRVDYAWIPGSIEEYVDRIDHALQDITKTSFAGKTDLVSLFSGGVDSSLVQSYLEPSCKPLFLAPQSTRPGAPDATEYARRAAQLLNVKLEISHLNDDDTWRGMENNIDMACWPQRVIQGVMLSRAFVREEKAFIIGQCADALLGAAGTRAGIIAAKSSHPLPHLGLQWLAALKIGSPSDRARHFLGLVAQIKRPASACDGWAAGMSSRGFADYGIIEEVVGAEVLCRELAERVDYVSARLGSAYDRASQLCRHLELAHWIDLLCEDHTTFMRQLGLAHGKSVHLPFISRRIVSQAMSVPTGQRYSRRLETKYLLKAALKRRLPSYPVRQRKGITSMRMPQTFEGQPRSSIWERYPISDFIPRRHWGAVKSFTNPSSHPALTLAILEQRVLRNPNLTMISGTDVLKVSTPRTSALTQRDLGPAACG